MTDLAKLKSLAQAATPGPWSVHGNGRDEWYVYALDARYETLPGNPSPVKVAWVLWSPGTLRHSHDAAYIASASPDVLLRLLDERDALRRERDEARAHLSAVLRHPARIRTGVMAAGYVGGACEHSPGERAKVTLFYEGAETAEAAFEHITEAIDALGEGHDGRDGGA